MAELNEMKILYVEDDVETREALQYFLKRRCGENFLCERCGICNDHL